MMRQSIRAFGLFARGVYLLMAPAADGGIRRRKTHRIFSPCNGPMVMCTRSRYRTELIELSRWGMPQLSWARTARTYSFSAVSLRGW
jgi:hypothetical protein